MIFKREIKSFSKRQRKLTLRQQAALSHCSERYGVELSDQQIDLNALFGRNAPCVLEIGFGHGESLWKMAKANPDKNYLAIEVHTPGIASLFIQMLENDVHNIRVIEGDAIAALHSNIPNHSLSRVQIFFPDPWQKKRHHKRRIIQPQFVQLLRDKLCDGGILHCATDWKDYAEHMMAVLSEAPGFKNVVGDGLFADNAQLQLRPTTKFEQRGIKLGHGVWDLLFLKCISHRNH